MVLVAGQAGADVGEDEVAPAVGGDQTVAGGQVHAQLPFLLANLVFNRGDMHTKTPVGMRFTLTQRCGPRT